MKYGFLLTSLVLTFNLAAQLSATLTVPRGHKGPVENCYFTPDDNYLVSIDDNQALCIWDGDDGRQLYTLRDSLWSFVKVEMDQNSSTIAALSGSGRMYIIDFRTFRTRLIPDSILDLSMNRFTGSIFFIAKKTGLNFYLPATGAIRKINTEKGTSPQTVFALSDEKAVVGEIDKPIRLVQANGSSRIIGAGLPTHFRLSDVHPSGYVLCESGGKIIRISIATGAMETVTGLNKNGNVNYSNSAFLSDPDQIVVSKVEVDVDQIPLDMEAPQLYSFRKKKVVGTLGNEFVSDIRALNMNFARRNVVVKRQFDYTFTFYDNYDFASNNSSVIFQHDYNKELHLKIACANRSKKVAIFSEDLLLPAIYLSGTVPENTLTGNKQSGSLLIDITRNKDTTKGADFQFYYSDEFVVNDSTRLRLSQTRDSVSSLFPGIVYRYRDKQMIDSFSFLYEHAIQPTPHSQQLFWASEHGFHILDLPRLSQRDSLSFPANTIQGLAREGDNILIERGSALAYQYSISRSRITDTARVTEGSLIMPYYEDDYFRRMEGYSIRDAYLKDFDFNRGYSFSYPMIPNAIDTIAILDSVGNITSYQAFAKENLLHISPLDSTRGRERYVSDGIQGLSIQQVRYWDKDLYVLLTDQQKLLIYSMNMDSIIREIACPTNFVITTRSRLFVQPVSKKLIVSDKEKNTCYIVDVAAGRIVAQLNGFYDPLIRQPDRLLILEDAAFGNYYIYNERYNPVSSITPFSKTDYVVTTASGLFDGTDNAVANLYLLINDSKDKAKPWKTIDLTQLKAKYYIPGLWDKLIAGDSTDLPDVKSIEHLSLAPAIITDTAYSFSKPYRITLIDQGGGIGPVRVAVNGKEIIPDARPSKRTVEKKMTIAVDLQPYRKYFTSGRNTIQVYSSNADSSLTTRGTVITSSGSPQERTNPKLFVISIGTSNYKGTEIDLQYSAKDAADIASALRMGAKRLFGADSTFVYTLTTDATDSSWLPTKTNIEQVFRQVGRKAAAKDIVILYLSGHGINASGDFYYLTRDAYTANSSAYAFKEVLNAVGISSNEFTEYLKKVAALKQLLIIDACASGKLVENLVAHREIPYSTLKALDRLKDRTGTHIITGCAADAVSYEASKFGQGLLTYSLLEGMKGASLRESKFLDVDQWFQYARERVPQLASGLGGIQTPQMYSPSGNQSFDIAELDEEEKKLVPLAAERPVIVKSIFQENDRFADVAGIGRALDNLLAEKAFKENKFLFFPVDEFPGAFQVLGRYTMGAAGIEASVKVMRVGASEMALSFSVSGADARAVTESILGKIRDLK